MPSSVRLAFVTTPRGFAHKLARQLVAERAAACVNVIPGVVSHYKWEGRVRRDAEALLMIKTTVKSAPRLLRLVRANHPYKNPEVIWQKVDGGSPDYLRWVVAGAKAARR